MHSTVLVADIGGTKTRVGIANGRSVLVARERPTTTKEELFAFLRQAADEAKTARELRVGAAGPLLDDSITLSNAGFTLTRKELERQFRMPVRLMNDFVALGHAINALASKDYVVVQPGALGDVVVLIGPGTGLGLSVLRRTPEAFTPYPTEGSRASLPIRTAEEFALAQHLQEELGRPAEAEDAVSGRGLERIYRFLRHKHMTAPPDLSAADISTTYAFNRCSRDSMRLFAQLLARVARDAVVMNGAFGGVVIAGGVARRNLQLFDEQFRATFSHGSLERVLSELPMRVIVRPQAALLGAATMQADGASKRVPARKGGRR